MDLKVIQFHQYSTAEVQEAEIFDDHDVLREGGGPSPAPPRAPSAGSHTAPRRPRAVATGGREASGTQVWSRRTIAYYCAVY